MGICNSTQKNNKIQPLVVPNDEEAVEICYHGRPKTNNLNSRIVQDIGYNIEKGQKRNQTISECDYYDL